MPVVDERATVGAVVVRLAAEWRWASRGGSSGARRHPIGKRGWSGETGTHSALRHTRSQSAGRPVTVATAHAAAAAHAATAHLCHTAAPKVQLGQHVTPTPISCYNSTCTPKTIWSEAKRGSCLPPLLLLLLLLLLLHASLHAVVLVARRLHHVVAIHGGKKVAHLLLDAAEGSTRCIHHGSCHIPTATAHAAIGSCRNRPHTYHQLLTNLLPTQIWIVIRENFYDYGQRTAPPGSKYTGTPPVTPPPPTISAINSNRIKPNDSIRRRCVVSYYYDIILLHPVSLRSRYQYATHIQCHK